MFEDFVDYIKTSHIKQIEVDITSFPVQTLDL